MRASQALFGVNGQFVIAFDLTTEPVAADVSVGTASFNVDFVQDRITSYQDFRVWELPPEPASTALAQEESTATAFKSDDAPGSSSTLGQTTSTPQSTANP